jgi:hypothetical protein
MAGRGPAPTGSRSRERDERRAASGLVEVVADDETRGPDLPEGFDWPTATVTWWETWRESPQAQTFTDTDWSFLLDTATLHAEFWLGDRSVAAELRLRVAKFGATPEDRQRLKLSVGSPVAKTVRPPAAGSKDRRSRLLKAVGDD